MEDISEYFASTTIEDIASDIAIETRSFTEAEKMTFFDSFFEWLDAESISIIESKIDFVV